MKTDPTIHALALQFAGLHGGNTEAYHHAKDVLTWLSKKPLTERLTTEERERIKSTHRELTECINQSGADINYLKGKRTQLVIMFGSELFAEEGGSNEKE